MIDAPHSEEERMTDFKELCWHIDRYNAQETSKHIAKRLADVAKQGYWTGGTPPFGYGFVVVKVPENRVRKKLTINSCEAEVVSLIYSLFLDGDGQSGPMGTRSIADQLNTKGLLRRKQLWMPAKVRKILTDPTCIGKRIFGQRKPEAEQVLMDVPPIIDRQIFVEAQKQRMSGYRNQTACAF
jgi:hypothetical protein